MKTTRSRSRLLTDAQVQMILTWYPKRVDWKARRTEMRRRKQALEKTFGVSRMAINLIIARGPEYYVAAHADRARGRPPLISDPNQRALVHAWHAEWVALHAELAEIKPLAVLARELGVAESTLQRAITLRGEYKQASPERCEAERARRRQRIARLRHFNLYAD